MIAAMTLNAILTATTPAVAPPVGLGSGNGRERMPAGVEARRIGRA